MSTHELTDPVEKTKGTDLAEHPLRRHRPLARFRFCASLHARYRRRAGRSHRSPVHTRGGGIVVAGGRAHLGWRCYEEHRGTVCVEGRRRPLLTSSSSRPLHRRCRRRRRHHHYLTHCRHKKRTRRSRGAAGRDGGVDGWVSVGRPRRAG